MYFKSIAVSPYAFFMSSTHAYAPVCTCIHTSMHAHTDTYTNACTHTHLTDYSMQYQWNNMFMFKYAVYSYTVMLVIISYILDTKLLGQKNSFFTPTMCLFAQRRKKMGVKKHFISRNLEKIQYVF